MAWNFAVYLERVSLKFCRIAPTNPRAPDLVASSLTKHLVFQHLKFNLTTKQTNCMAETYHGSSTKHSVNARVYFVLPKQIHQLWLERTSGKKVRLKVAEP